MSAESLVGEAELILFAFLVLGALGATIELAYELISRKMSWARFWEILASVSVQIPSSLLERATGVVMFLAYAAVYQYIPWRHGIGWGAFFAAVLLVDFAHYWTHRWEHEVRALWTFHSVHHSSPIYNFSVAFRVVFFRAPFDLLYYLPLVVLGFHPLIVLTALGLVAVYQIWLHSEIIGKLGWFGLVFNTPSHHRVHHGSDEKYLDRNYGGILILWDRMFGTFQAEEERPTYGLTHPINSVNPFIVHFHEVGSLIRDLQKARSWTETWKYLFARPGWSPTLDNRTHGPS